MTQQSVGKLELPGEELDVAKMPGHWLLARLGKRVLRPGGLTMTRSLLKGLSIGPTDDVVEFAPGLGVTARMILEQHPLRYVGVERDASAAQWTARHLPAFPSVSVVTGAADTTGLPAGSASIVVGEAMLSMNTREHKQRIAAEAFRLLRPGGRYGIHELCITPDHMPDEEKQAIDHALSSAIHVGARPLRTQEWKSLLEEAGFRIAETGYAPMHLLQPGRVIQDEGLLGALRLAKNILLDAPARRRVFAMRKVFQQYRSNLSAIFIVAHKEG
ncbi:MAG: methyltransferase domain-containing protein [Rhizobiales bacterium]|nr:methyltransferase domain-containing protein [Hyphomicrobiales bacterium]